MQCLLDFKYMRKHENGEYIVTGLRSLERPSMIESGVFGHGNIFQGAHQTYKTVTTAKTPLYIVMYELGGFCDRLLDQYSRVRSLLLNPTYGPTPSMSLHTRTAPYVKTKWS